MPKSSYFYNQIVMSMPDKYSALRERVRAAFTQADGRYGYRRVHAPLTRDEGIVSEKVIRRLMREEGLMVVGRKKHKYSSYVGEINPPVPNLIERDFHADAPNTKWLTDLTEFPLPAGKVYRSPMVGQVRTMLRSSTRLYPGTNSLPLWMRPASDATRSTTS